MPVPMRLITPGQPMPDWYGAEQKMKASKDEEVSRHLVTFEALIRADALHPVVRDFIQGEIDRIMRIYKIVAVAADVAMMAGRWRMHAAETEPRSDIEHHAANS